MTLDVSSIKQKIEEFDQQHGSDAVCLGEAYLIYSDGATRERNPLGFLAPPPKDAKECAERIVQYVEIRLSLAREEFQVFKSQLEQHCRLIQQQGNCSNPAQPPSEEDIAKLKELRKKVMHWQGKLTAARKKVQESIPEHIKIRNQLCEENRQKTAEVLGQINQIEI